MRERKIGKSYGDKDISEVTPISEFYGLAALAVYICETEYFVVGSPGMDFFGNGKDKIDTYISNEEFWALLGTEPGSEPIPFNLLIPYNGSAKLDSIPGCGIIFPLLSSNKTLLGVLVIFDEQEKQISDSQIKATKELCNQISLLLDSVAYNELENFSELFELSEDLICISSIDGVLERVNPSFQRILGWRSDQLLGKSLFDFVFEKDKRSTRQKLKGLLSGVSSVSFTHKLLTAEQDYRTIEWVASIVPANGKVSVIGRDITEELDKQRKLSISEKKFKIFFENSQGLMCTHDLNGKLISVNDSGAKILGYSKFELEGKTLYNIVPPERHSYLDEYLSKIAVDGHGKGNMVTRAKDGTDRIWLFSNVLQRDSEGEAYVIGNAVDITDQQILENNLRHTKKILEQTNKVARVGGWEVDLLENKMEWTLITKEIHEVSSEFVPDLSTAINFYKQGESRTKIIKAINDIIEKGIPYDLELEILSAKGKELWVRSIGNGFFDGGKCVKLFGTFQDIDEYKRAELEVGKAKKLLDDILNAASDLCIIATDLNGIITVFNKGAENLLGYSSIEMVGKQSPEILYNRSDLLSALNLSDSNPMLYGFDLFEEISRQTAFTRHELQYIKRSGDKLDVSLVVSVITDPDGFKVGYLGVATDITQSKLMEEALSLERARLLAFVEHTPAAVAMLDNDMRYLAVSQKWLEDYQFDGAEIIGVSHYKMFPNLSEERKARHLEILRGKVDRREEDVFIDYQTDKHHFITLEMRPWYRSELEIGGMMIFTQDISGMIAQREELRAAKIHADEANLAKSEFLANMSHEIRTPLNGVIGFTDLLLKTKLDEVQQQYLRIVSQSGGALLNIINDILDFSKIEAGKFELDIGKCDLFEMTGQATDITTYQIHSKNLEMILNLNPNLPRFIWADDVRLKQVLVNLLGNASKFTEKGEIELKVVVLEQIEDKCLFRFSIRDTGIGIQPDKQEKIFEAFAQEDSSTTKRYGGTGLGLTISNKLLKMMGSKLELKSNPGEGSIFYFDILLASEQGEAIEWLEIGSVKKALIVDDNDNNRSIISEMLMLKGIEADLAKSGFEALQYLAEGSKYDVVLMDYHMPFMDGLETIEKIRSSFFPTHELLPIILLHSSADDNTLIKASNNLQVQHRLVKPIKMSDLYKALSKLHLRQGFEMPKTFQQNMSVATVDDIKSGLVVMIVEDNEVNLFLTRSLINNMHPNIKIVEAKNGQEGVLLFLKHKPDLVLMDIQMPVMNGYEASRKIRVQEQTGHTPIIALTAGIVSGERERCLEAGMDDFITKPILKGSLEAIMSRWILKKAIMPNESTHQGNENSQHFDPNQLSLYYGEDKQKLANIASLTIKQLDLAIAEFVDLIETNDIGNINLLGHKLYGTSVSAGLSVLAKIAADFESFSGDTFSLNKLFDKFSTEVEILKTILIKRYLG